MIKTKIRKILSITHGRLLNGNPEEFCKTIEIDSRNVKKSSAGKTIFMPILGEVQDGHIFLLKAFENGAPYSFCEVEYFNENKEKLKEKNLILVENTTKALHLLTTYVLDECNVKKVGVTGSLGKTSTKEMIYHVLSQKYNVHKNNGNFNNHIGLPLTVFDLSREHDVVVLEMGMNHFKEIETLVHMVRPDIGVITNIGTSHIGILGSQDGIFQAKMEMTTYFGEDNTLILNGDDVYLSRLQSDDYKVLKVGTCSNSTVCAYDLKRQENGCYSYKIDYDSNIYEVKLSVLGKHNVINSLLALTVGLELSVPMEDCIAGLLKFVENEKRLELIDIFENNIVISDCYNASSESMISALDVLVEMPGKTKIAVLGDVLELGDYSRESHEKVGKYLSEIEVDYIFTYGEASKHIKSKAAECGFNANNIFSFVSKEELMSSLYKVIKSNDVILVKGSLGMDMIKIVNDLESYKK